MGQILEAAFREAAAVVVLLTPDDEARLRSMFAKPTDPASERDLTGQAHPNVLFEAGMAFGKDPNSTVLVQIGEVRPFSDIAGRHLVHLGNDPTSRQEFVTKLANAGCNVDTSGTDWLSVGSLRRRALAGGCTTLVPPKAHSSGAEAAEAWFAPLSGHRWTVLAHKSRCGI